MLYKGDCLEIMGTLPDNSIDLILCDLPYGTTACAWDAVIPFEPLWKHYKRLIKDNGAIVLFSAQPFTSALIMSNTDMFKYTWTWVKDKGANFGVAKYRPINLTEEICVFGKGTTNYYPQKYDAGYKKNKGGKNSTIKGVYGQNGFKWSYDDSEMQFPKNVLCYPTPKHNDEMNGSLHPTQKPVEIMKYLIATYTKQGEMVMDNTMGSGTTGVACAKLQREFIGIEMNDEYFEDAKKRIENELLQTFLF